MPAASTTTLSVQVLDFEDMRLLIQRGRLYAISVRQASVLPAASFRSCFAAGTLAVRLTVPLAGSVRDFHSQVSAPCRAHTKKKPDGLCHRALFIVWALKLHDVGSLVALGTLRHVKFDGLAFFQGLVSLALNRGVMHEDISATFAGNKSITF